MATTRRVVNERAVADAVDVVEDRDRSGRPAAGSTRAASAPSRARVDRAGRGDERLAGDLAAEHPLALLVGADAAEDVDLDRLEVEELDELVDRGLGHRPSLARHAANVTPMSTTRSPTASVWGTATAAHQIEGGNWNNDWWAVGAHARARAASSRAATRCDSLAPLAGGRRAVSPTSGFDNYRFSIEWSRIEPEEGEFSIAAARPLPRDVRGAARARASIRSSRSITSRRRAGWRRRAAGTEPATADAFARFCERGRGAPRRRRSRRACTINEPNIVATMRLHARACSRRASATSSCGARVNDVFVDAHRKAVDAIRAAAPGVPVGLTLSMTDYQAVDGGEAKRDQIRRPHGGRVPRGAPRATTSSACRPTRARGSARTACSAPRPGVPDAADGLRVLARRRWRRRIRRAWEVTGGRSRARHRERHRHRRRRRSASSTSTQALEGVLRRDRRRHRRARLHVLEPARQLRVGLRLRPPLRPRRRRPHHVRAHAEAERPLARRHRQGQRPVLCATSASAHWRADADFGAGGRISRCLPR